MTRFWLSAWTLTTLLCAAQIPPGRRSEEQVRAANQQEVQAFLSNDANAMARLWSDNMVITNPLNKFVTK